MLQKEAGCARLLPQRVGSSGLLSDTQGNGHGEPCAESIHHMGDTLRLIMDLAGLQDESVHAESHGPLRRLELAGFLIATRIGTAARRNLGNAEFQRPLPDSRFFPSGHDNARVRHGKAQYGDKLARSRCTAAGRPNPTRWPVRCGTLMVCQPTPNRSSRCAMWAMSANVSNRQSYKPVEQPHAHVVDARLHGTVE